MNNEQASRWGRRLGLGMGLFLLALVGVVAWEYPGRMLLGFLVVCALCWRVGVKHENDSERRNPSGRAPDGRHWQ